MKRLIVALVAAVAFSTAFARLTDTQSFEESFSDFVPSIVDEDASELADYAGDAPAFPAPYNFADFGLKYLSLDTGDATLWRTNAGDAAYFDMAMQFNPCASAPEIDEDTKIAVYLNSSSNLVVLAGTELGDGTSTNVTGVQLAPGTWGRLTIAASANQFTVTLNTNTVVGTYYSRKLGDTTIKQVGFKGTGALDDFVARTTDPFIQNPAALIGGEGYANYSDALTEALAGYAANAPVTITIPGETPLFMDGSAAAPYAIPDANSLKALAAAVQNNPAVRSLCYEQTADITWDGTPFEGIGTYDTIAFTGVYDGGNYRISGVTLTARKYAGIFNKVDSPALIKNLVVENLGFVPNPTGDYGCAIVGSGVATMENLTSKYVGGFSSTNTHNAGGIMVRALGGTLFKSCTNTADLVCTRDKLGGICCFSSGNVTFTNCVNSGNLTLVTPAGAPKYDPASNGFAGIIGYASGTSNTTTLKDCVNTGLFIDDLDTSVYSNAYYFGQYIGKNMGIFADLGGNMFLMPGTNLVGTGSSGCKYAMVDGTETVGMTVQQADLVVNNEYLVLQDIAASATPVFTLTTAADYIAFNTNGYNFAGSVLGSSTIAVTESTSDSVITFTGVAGVASVNDVAYATFDEAVEAVATAPEGHQFIELLADASVNFDAAGTTLAVRENAHTLTVTTTGDIAVTKTPNASTGIFTYTTADGVAAVAFYQGGTPQPEVWYATFDEAYAAAYAVGTTTLSDLKVKVGSNFAPGVMDGSMLFVHVTFVATTDDPITISMSNGSHYFYAYNSYTFPTNATLTLPATTEYPIWRVVGGTLNIPSGVELEIASYDNYGSNWDITGLSGSGTIKNNGKNLYSFIGNPNYKLPTCMRGSSWCGTLELSGSNTWEAEFNKFANANSKVRFNGLTTPLWSSGNDSVAIELVGSGLTISGEYQSARTYAVGGTITGSGALALADNTGSLLLSGDVSGFTGNVTAAGTASAITFGSATTGSGQRIVVGGGGSVTNAAGATWTAANVIVRGELVANGTMTVSNKLWGDSGSGVYRANTTSAAVPVAESWNGTYYANFKLANNAPFYIPINASARTVINGSNGEFGGYPRFGSGAPNVAGSVVLNANWTIGDGYPGAGSKTTFAKLSGDGSLTTCTKTVSGTVYYEITELENYTNGVLTVSAGTDVTIGLVNLHSQPTNGAIIVKTAKSGSLNDDVPLYVGGVNTGKTLTYNASGADGAGLYYYEPVVSYTITLNANGGAVDPASTNYTADTAAFDLPIATTSNVGVQFAGWTNETITVAFTNFVPGTTAALGDLMLYAKWETSGNPQTIDPASATPTATFAAESEADAKEKVSLVTPAGVDAAEYKANFDFSAKSNGDGTYTVTLTGIKDEVTADVGKDAVEILTGASSTGKVDVPAGLYYRITRYTAIGTPVSETPATGQSDGTGVEVIKPGVTQGFIKVELGTAPFAAE